MDELLQKIADDWRLFCGVDPKIAAIKPLIEAGTATYTQAHEYAVRVGEILHAQFMKYAGQMVNEEGRLVYEAAEGILRPLLGISTNDVADICEEIQADMNRMAEISLAPIRPTPSENRISGIVTNALEAATLEDSDLAENMVNINQHVVDTSVRTNAKFHHDAGLRTVLVRESETPYVGTDKRGRKYKAPCDWCEGLAGTYEYGKAPSEIYHRHAGCRCNTTFISGKTWQDVWSKEGGTWQG